VRVLYFKVDETTRAEYEQVDFQPFKPTPIGR
jgi:hypothetical protein